MAMNWEVLSWGLVVISLAGNIFIIKKSVIGQWLWALSNIGWIAYNLTLNAYAQAFLFLVYLGMCIWGILAWSKKPKEADRQISEVSSA
ncbi:nicotinamide mononucleotide transporter family protein [Candidatus Berkiella cookevillensis]|uniref:Nicotinamide mononucleotide transporter family protein n=1 Tax=Candidatus Berkiella cookevillensis TaxID=437022 RepID=A0A0Q9YSV5_9GAMM|nr:nicotinamide mononucleotide transporter [Candidatus Berkiella cookevillensis]MCS5709367.1 nicotinamide mononucleotide transporter family protein [Candidatus Berkiella cookevillensis]